MSTTHQFQRYSSKENVVTNNTLRLLGEVHDAGTKRLEELLSSVIDGISVDLSLQMSQQESGPKSVPDGRLSQPRFQLVLETKRGGTFDEDQLKRHLEAFDGEGQEVLLLLSREKPDEAGLRRVEETAREQGVDFGAITFSDLIDALIGEEGLLGIHERDLRATVRDFESFCSEENLLISDDVLRAVPCGDSHDVNVRQDLYYMPASRGYRSHDYVGLYFDKSIRYVGKTVKDVVVNLEDGELVGDTNSLDEDERERIKGAIWPSIEKDYRFFLVEEFYATDFEKTSKYGMMGAQYFSLREELDINGDLPDTEEIAQRLKEESWE
jgi:hypothetical protein